MQDSFFDGERQFPDWPDAPQEGRPKFLYVNKKVNITEVLELHDRGWLVCDVRALPARSDYERSEAVKAYLEGVRVGSIKPDDDVLKYVNLEAKICGLLEKGTLSKDDGGNKGKDDMESILSFGKDEITLGLPEVKRGRGRPKKVKE